MGTKKSVILPILISAMLIMLMAGCDDSGVAPKPGNSTEPPKPNIIFRPGAVYYFTNDTISASGALGSTTWLTTSTVLTQSSYNGKICYPISSITRDTFFTFPPIIRSETEYFHYDPATYIFYQFGVKKLFDSTQFGTWDPVADFSKSLGTKVPMFTFVVLGITFQVSSTVESQTTVQTTAQTPVSIDCYKVNVEAEVVGSPGSKATMDYYIGFTPSTNPNNPVGRIQFKVPTSVQNIPPIPGGQQRMNRFTMP